MVTLSEDPQVRGGPLAGRTVLVTGASSGIGRAIARAAAAAGADVALTFLANADGARSVAREIVAVGRRAAVFQLDLRDESSIAALATAVVKEFGRVDTWINNAGADILTGRNAELSTLRKLEALIAVDLRGTMLASWEAARVMRGQPQGGVIINMSWDHALTGMPGTNPEMFSAVKGGILSFSKSLARSVAPAIRVNVLAPGWIETAFGADLVPARHRAVAESTPLGRWGTPDDVAHAAIYLASPAASFLTGQVVLVNGGVVM